MFLLAGGYHHHIGLNTWESAGGPQRCCPGPTGLYQRGNPVPDPRGTGGRRFAGVVRAGVPLEGASDHGVSEAIYLRVGGTFYAPAGVAVGYG